MSGATNGKRAVEGWKSMEEKTGQKLGAKSAEPREEEDYTLDAITVQPRTCHIHTCLEWNRKG